MTVTYVGLAKVQEMYKNLAKLTDSIDMANSIWKAGILLRVACQQSAYELIYSTPESKNYKRTSYLRNSLYLTMLRRTDRAEMHAKAYAGAEATYPNRSNNAKTYKLVPHIPYPTKRAVRLTAGAIYADSVEYGTGNNKAGPRPFMRNGADKSAREVSQYLEDEIARLIKKIETGKKLQSAI